MNTLKVASRLPKEIAYKAHSLKKGKDRFDNKLACFKSGKVVTFLEKHATPGGIESCVATGATGGLDDRLITTLKGLNLGLKRDWFYVIIPFKTLKQQTKNPFHIQPHLGL